MINLPLLILFPLTFLHFSRSFDSSSTTPAVTRSSCTQSSRHLGLSWCFTYPRSSPPPKHRYSVFSRLIFHSHPPGTFSMSQTFFFKSLLVSDQITTTSANTIDHCAVCLIPFDSPSQPRIVESSRVTGSILGGRPLSLRMPTTVLI